MGNINTKEPVVLFMAAFTAEQDGFERVREKLESLYGPIVAESETVFVEDFTHYYQSSMGGHLAKRLWAFERLIDPESIAEIKRQTNELEELFTEESQKRNANSPQRAWNLDPGYVDLGKLVLASTKDHSHRIYLQRGIFAEVTLIYTKKRWQELPWTYPDYKTPIYQRFLDRVRDYLYEKLRD